MLLNTKWYALKFADTFTKYSKNHVSTSNCSLLLRPSYIVSSFLEKNCQWKSKNWKFLKLFSSLISMQYWYSIFYCKMTNFLQMKILKVLQFSFFEGLITQDWFSISFDAQLIKFFKIYFGKFEEFFEWNFHSLCSVTISALVQPLWSQNDSCNMNLSKLYLCHKRLEKELIVQPERDIETELLLS